MKFYSSGMYVRLAFAVAVHVDPEILLVDEVLAVGDEPFQRKCMERIKQFQREGRTIVFVTHGLDQVRQLCDRVIMLETARWWWTAPRWTPCGPSGSATTSRPARSPSTATGGWRSSRRS